MLQDELKEIRTQLRMAMNGIISTSMREKGVVYKLNFGVPLSEVKEIAAKHTPSSELAAALWKEDIREFKLLAPMLQPVEEFPFKQAEQWVKEIPYLEIAEQCSRNLFCKLPYVDNLLLGLIFNVEDEYARTVAYLIWTELFKGGERCVCSGKSCLYCRMYAYGCLARLWRFLERKAGGGEGNEVLRAPVGRSCQTNIERF